jgi:exonuclease SbcD
VAAYDGLTDHAGVIVRGGYGRAGAVTTLELPDGPVDVVAVPYLDPVLTPPGWLDAAVSAPAGAEARPAALAPPSSTPPEVDVEPMVLSLFDQLEPALPSPAVGGAPVRRSHHTVLEHALVQARAGRRSPRSIVVAHAFVTGAMASESERLLSIGGSAEVGTELFEGFDYVALGHLHQPQRVRAGLDTVRYSGTPLPYSFSETHPKQVLLVDMAPDGAATVRAVEVPVGRAVATVTGTLDELLGDPRHDRATDRFVRAVLTDRGYVVDAKSRLQSRFPHVVEIVHEPTVVDGDAAVVVTGRRRLAPLDAAVGFWTDVTGEPPAELERSLLESVLAHVAAAEAGV